MGNAFSRRDFLTAGLVLPAALMPRAPQATRTPELAYRTLGKTGLKVTTLSFGCMTNSEPSVIARAADLGINHFDTARAYQNGHNERLVGLALKERRKQVIISSKSGARTGAQALADLETSLRELGTDYLDIWYLHTKSEPSEVTDELLEAQRAAKKDGKIRFSGVSTHFNMDRMLSHLAKLGQTDVALTTYNFSMRSVASDRNTDTQAPKTDMTGIIRSARQSGLGIIVMKTMSGGVTRVGRGDRLYGADPQLLSKQLAREGVPVAAIKWALKNESVDAAIVCMTNHDQLDQNLRAMAEPFTQKDEDLLRFQLADISPTYCRMCGSCGGVCEKGVPVPDVLRFLTYAEGYAQFSMARQHFLALPERVRAVRCDQCPTCSVRCPNGVKVRERLTLAQEMFA
jgi:aryl-alcohol dehydrogenase-like predicted oxidoreductase